MRHRGNAKKKKKWEEGGGEKPIGFVRGGGRRGAGQAGNYRKGAGNAARKGEAQESIRSEGKKTGLFGIRVKSRRGWHTKRLDLWGANASKKETMGKRS